MPSQPLDLTPIQNRLNQAHLAEGHEAKSKAWSDLYQHAPDDIAALIAEIDRLRAEHQEHPNKRLIHTAEELRELPEETIICDIYGDTYQNSTWVWWIPGHVDSWEFDEIPLPARVIYTPEEGEHG